MLYFIKIIIIIITVINSPTFVLKGTSTTYNIESGRNPGMNKEDDTHMASKGRPLLLQYSRFSAYMPSIPHDLVFSS